MVTKLNPEYWRELPHKRVFNLAWPMILSNLSSPLMTLADTAMLGHRETPLYLGAVAIGGNILALLFWIFSFLRMSTTSLVGQALGANNLHARAQHLLQTSILAFLFGGVLILLQWVIVPFAVALMTNDGELRQLASEYCHIRVMAAPAVFLNYVLFGWLIGHQNTRLPLVITLCANLLNLGLDYLFIVVFDKGSQGAATASLIAELFACGLALFLVLPEIKKLIPYFKGRTSQLFSGWKKLIKLNSDLMLRTLLLLLVFNFFTARGGYFSVTILAANALLMQLAFTTAYALDGYAHATETLVAHWVGAKNIVQFYRSCLAALFASLVIAFAISATFVLSQDLLLALLTDQLLVRQAALSYWNWLVLLPIVSVWCYLLDGIFIGAGKSRTLRNTMILGVIGIFVPAWWWLQPLENHGLWAAFTIFNAFRGASLTCAFYTNVRQQNWFI